MLHLTVLLIRLNLKIQQRRCPRVASRSNVLRIHWTVRNLRNVPGSVRFLWTKKQYHQFAAIPIQRQPSLNRDENWSKQKDKELNTFVKHSVVDSASRQGISPSALMKMRWAVTFKDCGQLRSTVDTAKFYGPKAWLDHNILSNRIPLELVRFS